MSWYTKDVTDSSDPIVKKEQLEITSEPPKVVPKLATKVAVTKATSGNVILTFVFTLPGEGAHLIERIVMDGATTKEVAKLLNKATEEVSDAK